MSAAIYRIQKLKQRGNYCEERGTDYINETRKKVLAPIFKADNKTTILEKLRDKSI